MGEWIDVPYSAANFSAPSGTWVVDAADVSTYQYTLIGKTIIIAFYIVNTTVTGTNAYLRLAIPGGFLAAKEQRGNGQANDAAAATVAGLMRVTPGGAYIELYKTLAGGNWSAATNTTNFAGQFMFSIQ
jgi:hypothetical protein